MRQYFKSNQRSVLLLSVIILAALLIRLPFMGRGLWFDEIFTANVVTFDRSATSIISYLRNNDPHPPLHYLLLRGWSILLDLHAWPDLSPGIEWKLRLPSLVLGLISIPLAYAVGLRFSRWSAWSAAIAVAFSPFTLGESVEARMYSTITFLLLASWLLIFRGSRRSLVVVGILNAIGIWHQVIFGIVIIAQIIYFIGTWGIKQNWRKYLYAFLPSATFILWIPILYNLYKNFGTNASIRAPADKVGILLFDYLTGRNSVFNVIIFAVVVIALLKTVERGFITQFFAVTLAVPFIWILSSLFINISSVRYAGFVVPGFALAVGYGISAIQAYAAKRFVNPKYGVVVPIVLFSIYGAAQLTVPREFRVLKEPWREVATYLAPRLKDGDTVAVMEAGRQMSLLYYLRTTAKFQNVVADGAAIPVLDASRLWLIPNSFGAGVKQQADFDAWWQRVRQTNRATKMMQTQQFDLFLVQPETNGHAGP